MPAELPLNPGAQAPQHSAKTSARGHHLEDVTSLRGPVELAGGQLTLRIPLEAGGAAFVECARRIGRIDGDDFVIVIPDWLARQLGITAESTVAIDDAGGRFNVRALPPE